MLLMVDEPGAWRVGRTATLFDTQSIEYGRRAATARAVPALTALLRAAYPVRAAAAEEIVGDRRSSTTRPDA
jgi:hypothetical protein